MIGSLVEHGPVKLTNLQVNFAEPNNHNNNDAEPQLAFNPYSWNNNSNILYVDQPLLTGYSTLPAAAPLSPLNLTQIGQFMLNFLLNFYKYTTIGAELVAQPLFLTGESFAGHYIPYIAREIQRFNAENRAKSIKLAGLAIGNGFFSVIQRFSYRNELFSAGLISYSENQRLIGQEIACTAAFLANSPQIYSICNEIFQLIAQFTGNIDFYDIRSYFHSYNTSKLADFLAKNEIKQFFHAKLDQNNKDYHCNPRVLEQLTPEIYQATTELLTSVVKNPISPLKLLIYSGNFDLRDNSASLLTLFGGFGHFPGLITTEKAIWRSKTQENSVFGSIITLNSINFVVVSQAGHFVALDQPRKAQEMIENWVFGRNFTGQSSKSARSSGNSCNNSGKVGSNCQITVISLNSGPNSYQSAPISLGQQEETLIYFNFSYNSAENAQNSQYLVLESQSLSSNSATSLQFSLLRYISGKSSQMKETVDKLAQFDRSLQFFNDNFPVKAMKPVELPELLSFQRPDGPSHCLILQLIHQNGSNQANFLENPSEAAIINHYGMRIANIGAERMDFQLNMTLVSAEIYFSRCSTRALGPESEPFPLSIQLWLAAMGIILLLGCACEFVRRNSLQNKLNYAQLHPELGAQQGNSRRNSVNSVDLSLEGNVKREPSKGNEDQTGLLRSGRGTVGLTE
jgi:hypothetical protein